MAEGRLGKESPSVQVKAETGDAAGRFGGQGAKGFAGAACEAKTGRLPPALSAERVRVERLRFQSIGKDAVQGSAVHASHVSVQKRPQRRADLAHAGPRMPSSPIPLWYAC